MEFELKQALTKTPQGINATRSGEGLSPRAHGVLRAFDGIKSVADLKKLCVGAALPEAEFETALKELRKFEYIRVADAAAEAKARAEAEAERKMLMTLDFTAALDEMPVKPAKPAVTATPAAPAKTAPAAVPVTATPGAATPAVNAALAAAAAERRAREEKAARMKAEAEIRQKMVAELQPRVEEELRARLRPKLEEELRPKLIAALRPGVEAEVRTTLIKELTPRVELELKARFAKTLAAQRAADEQAAKAEAPAPVLAAAPTADAASVPATDSAFERVLASMNLPVFSVDMAGGCRYLSPAWAQFSGFATADCVGKPLAEYFAPADRRGVSAFLNGIAGGTALRFEHQGALIRNDGEALWVELSAAPLYAADGSPMGVCGALRDAGESRRVAEQAEADGVRLLLLVDQIDTGVILEDSEGSIQQVNAALCALLALDAAPYSLEGMAVEDLLSRAAGGFIGPEGFMSRVQAIRLAGMDVKGENFIMGDGRVLALDYLGITVSDSAAGRLWLLREVPRAQSRGEA